MNTPRIAASEIIGCTAARALAPINTKEGMDR
jgi:hypothetical protein